MLEPPAPAPPAPAPPVAPPPAPAPPDAAPPVPAPPVTAPPAPAPPVAAPPVLVPPVATPPVATAPPEAPPVEGPDPLVPFPPTPAAPVPAGAPSPGSPGSGTADTQPLNATGSAAMKRRGTAEMVRRRMTTDIPGFLTSDLAPDASFSFLASVPQHDSTNLRSALNQTSLCSKPGKLAFGPLGFGTTKTRASPMVSGFAPAPPLRGSRKYIW